MKKEKCKNCDGLGIIITDLVFTNDDFGRNIDCGTREDKCEACDGTGNKRNE
jgi:hypothetical protein